LHNLQPIDPSNAGGVSEHFGLQSGQPRAGEVRALGRQRRDHHRGRHVFLAKVSNGIACTDLEAVSSAAATTGNLFRYDATAGQYIFNWNTKGLRAGTYRLFIDLGDGVERTVDVGLR